VEFKNDGFEAAVALNSLLKTVVGDLIGVCHRRLPGGWLGRKKREEQPREKANLVLFITSPREENKPPADDLSVGVNP
jgi:hypothetical protein